MKPAHTNTHTKAQSMSINTIIIAVLALIVLVVIIVIFTGKLRESSVQVGKQQEAFTGTACEIPGTPRVCRDDVDCVNRGGSIVNADCDSGVCCSV